MRILFCFLWMSVQLSACALCASYTPTTFVNFDFNATSDKIQSINIKWEFSKEFTQTLLENYDLNYNDNFDAEELEMIESALLDYLKPNEFLTELSLHQNDKMSAIKTQFRPGELLFKDSQFFYHYEAFFEVGLENEKIFHLKIHDPNGFFQFIFQNPKELQLNENFYLSANDNLDFVFFQILSGKIKENSKQNPAQQDQNLKHSFANFNNALFASLKELLKKDTDAKTLFLLALLSFGYGIFHATGPGHAKTLTSSYFLTHKSSNKKILYFCLKIALIHTLSAFLLVSFALLFLDVFLRSFSKDASFILTQISSVLIILIALFMLGKKILSPKHPHNCSCCHQSPSPLSEWALISAAAIVPCPGTLLLFIFAYEINFISASISAIFTSLGMCFILFILALLSNKIHFKFKGLRFFLEYLGICLMLFFGFFIFISAQKGVF
ncbi:DUF1007 family protein [Campylobacter sp.]|uniref:HoxN/HupN/NixA family nickel/cobalt transporter n=1 Tax=Campylobacter sp. TaxID=205 RepID=UPI0026DD0E4F|nr:DUF1007 family protein [Campylobacter sp.]MDO4674370.1 DUF1007 family protein [Campylobacter sp.]